MAEKATIFNIHNFNLTTAGMNGLIWKPSCLKGPHMAMHACHKAHRQREKKRQNDKLSILNTQIVYFSLEQNREREPIQRSKNPYERSRSPKLIIHDVKTSILD